MLVDLSKRLKDRILAAMSSDYQCQFRPHLVLHNPNTEYKLEVRLIHDIAIEQKFADLGNDADLHDLVRVTIDMNLEELQEMQANVTDLEASLTLEPVYPDTGDICYKQDPIIFEAMAMPTSQIDIEKLINVNAFKNTDTGEKSTPDQTQQDHKMTFDLIHKKIYELKNRLSLGGIVQEDTLENVIHDIAHDFDIDVVDVVAPDNDSPLTNVMWPVGSKLADILNRLQQQRNIYSKGLAFYVTTKENGDSWLSVYPAFDKDRNTSPVEEGIVHFIACPPNSFFGGTRYHAYEDDDLLIAVVNPSGGNSLTGEGAENVGNVQLATKADGVIDGIGKVQDDGSTKVDPNKTMMLVQSQNTGGLINKDSQHVNYVGESSSVYESTSAMAAVNSTIMRVNWIQAMPWIIKPGHNCEYHYDSDNGEYKTQQGRVMKVIMTTKPILHFDLQPDFVFLCVIDLLLEPEQKSEDTYQFNQN